MNHNPYGFVPFGTARHNRPEQAEELRTVDTLVTFGPAHTGDETDVDDYHGTDATSLVGLASCVNIDHNAPQVAQRLYDFARVSGPLFGEERTEVLRDWAYAANNAHLAVSIQNSLRLGGIRGLARSRRVYRRSLTLGSDSPSIPIVHARLYASGPYDRMLGACDVTREERAGDGLRYGFTVRAGRVEDDKGAGLSCVDVYALGTDEPLSRGLFDRLSRQLLIPSGSSPEATDALGRRLGVWQDVESPLATCDEMMAPTPSDPKGPEGALPVEELDDRDAHLLELLVRTIAEVHYRGARVDVFGGAPEAGYISFESALQWLWFDFARGMARTQIAYCEQCGKAFSVMGHRGMRRRYCSDACRTAAKNDRSRRDTRLTRELFRKGKPVDEIAREVYGGSHADVARVRTRLSTWVALKDELEQSVKDDGWEASALLQRCEREGLDMQRLLRGRYLRQYVESHPSEARPSGTQARPR